MCFIQFHATTTDLHSLRQQDSYNGVTVRYIDLDYQIQSRVLHVLEFPESHTSESIASSELQNSPQLRDYQIQSLILGIREFPE